MKPSILHKNLMILASAGSGKTFQLGNRVIGLIGAEGVDPAKIVALTFTRKAAGEFADSVLTKLAECAVDAEKASKLCAEIGREISFPETLAKVVRTLPRFQLGTMDGFFARVVRGFQYELGLTGGTFELIEGPKLEAALSDILVGVLGDALVHDGAEEFLHAFRRATLGKEGQGVLASVEKFLQSWHGWWKDGWPLEAWGGDDVFGELPAVEAWEEQKGKLLSALRADESELKVIELIEAFELHTIGSGKVKEHGKTLFERMVEAVSGSGVIEVVLGKKPIRFTPGASERWRELFHFLAACELSAAVSRTKAVAALVSGLDAECERRLRRKGLLGFDDVKVLMGQWVRTEEARLRREAVDFRLDARYDHWLLDEFQDTSRAEWTGIVPLLDEAATSEDGSVFVVGDRKQAIYGWRGGDVTLFDEVSNRYNGDGSLGVRTMPDSWRSCPAVLDLVNVVCGDKATVGELFGAAMAVRWRWEDHVSAKPMLTGESRVEVVAKEDREDRLIELLREIGVGERALTCGVLVRTNTQVREIASLLREEGFDVIEEGRRRPLEDNAVGVALFHLIKWLADPADAFARELIAISPLSGIIDSRFGEVWQKAWEGLLEDAQARGFATMAESVIEPLWEGLSEFSRRRAGDVMAALAQFDASGGSSAREAARWLEGLEIAQSPGTAAVQVMTVHKSKGLGFDVVILPEIEDTQVPDRGDFTIAKGVSSGRKWLLEPPSGWVRKLVPALAEAEEQWADDQRYEAMCVLYVALTRAKRGLYVLLPEPPKSRKKSEAWSSPASWITSSASRLDGPTIFQSGDPGWFRSIESREVKPQQKMPGLGESVPRRERSTPSSSKKSSGVAIARSPSGMKFGSEVHEAFERIAWIDEEDVLLPQTEAGRLVRELMVSPLLRPLFERKGRAIDLHREQSFDVVIDGVWMSGIMDRLHVHRDESGRVVLMEVIDFKTDAVERPEELIERYAGQMDAYQKALNLMHADAEVRCLLVSTRLRAVFECP